MKLRSYPAVYDEAWPPRTSRYRFVRLWNRLADWWNIRKLPRMAQGGVKDE